MILLPPPVPETSEEVVGEETVNGVPYDVDVDGLLYPEPDRQRDRWTGTYLYRVHSTVLHSGAVLGPS